MENLKVLVKSIDEYNEAKNLVYELNRDDWVICQDSKGKGTKGFIECEYKQVTIGQLRGMVVLKRNNVSDATHEYRKGFGDNFKYREFDDGWYFFGCNGWRKSANIDHDKLKPIQNNDLPFIDSEESLNDKVASAEEARQKQPNQKTIDAMREAEDIINKKHSHYKKDVSHLGFIDVYRVLDLFEVESHAVGHAVKKLLCSGQRGAKDKAQDIQEAIDSLNRELEMMRENGNS